MNRGPKILFLFLFALLLGIVLLLPHGSYRRKVEAYKKQLLAQGEKLTVAELTPLPVPLTDPSNGAVAFKTLMSGYFVSSPLPNMMTLIAPGVVHPQFDSLTAEQMADYERNTRAVANLRPVLNTSVLDFNLNYPAGSSIPLPHLSWLRQAEASAADAALQALHSRDPAGAAADLDAAVDVVRLSPHEPFLVSDMVRVVIARVATTATWEALQSGQFSEAQLAKLQTNWNRVNLFDGTEAAFAMERAMILADIPLGRKSYDSNMIGLWSVPVTTPPVSGWLGNLRRTAGRLYDRYPGYWAWRSSWSYDEELYCLQVMDAALQLARRARDTDALLPALKDYDSRTNAIIRLHPATGHFYFFHAGQELVLRNYLTRLARAETGRRLMVVALALQRHKLLHGSYPAALAELVPDLLPAVPADFMDGRLLRYKLKPDGTFLLYSIGEDGEDNGGDGTPTASGADWLQARDIIWPRAATPQELQDYLTRHPPETNSPAR